MKIIVFRYLLFTFASVLVFCTRSTVFAHGSEPRIEIGAERLNPGSTLEIRGVDFEFEEQVTLALMGSQLEIPLGVVTADTEGIFLTIITMPADLAEGIYIIRATTDDHVVNSPQITVWGSAVLEEEGEGRLDEEEGYGLLAPMPTYLPAVATVPVPQDPVEAGPTPARTRNWIALAALMVAVLLGFGILRKMAR